MKRTSIYDLSFHALETALVGDGISLTHAKPLWRSLYRGDGVRDDAKFLPPLKRWVTEHVGEGRRYENYFPQLETEWHSSDGLTRKFLLRMQDDQTVETVLMRYSGRHTVCVSSQVGCAMGCVFCATGQMGFVRHLSTAEIVTQVLYANQALLKSTGERLRNIVFMGMGEPLHNYDSLMNALRILLDRRGLSFGASRISVSTVGVVPGILKLANSGTGVNLAVSLHGSSEEERGALVPISKRWSLAELVTACREYTDITGRQIFFEWTLIEGKNDSVDAARRLGELLKGIPSHVNLIPLNQTQGFDGHASGVEAAYAFQRELHRFGIPSTIRQHRGIDVAAGCGQLRAERQIYPAKQQVKKNCLSGNNV